MTIASSADTARHPRLFVRWALGLLLLWLIALLAGPALLASVGVSLNPHGHVHLYAHGHPFVDARSWWGVPNTLDVVTNIPLLLAGLWGLRTLRRVHIRLPSMPSATIDALQVFLVGLVFTSQASAWYHWAPDAAGLVWDRLGMAVTFAGALGLAVAERVGQAPARATLFVACVAAAASAVLPYSHGNVLPWAVVQYGGVALITWAALRRPAPDAIGIGIGTLIALYVLAKLLELGDEAVFDATGRSVSGHSLKHLLAAGAAWPVLSGLNRISPMRQPAPRSATTTSISPPPRRPAPAATRSRRSAARRTLPN